jgi:hypothetical protein
MVLMHMRMLMELGRVKLELFPGQFHAAFDDAAGQRSAPVEAILEVCSSEHRFRYFRAELLGQRFFESLDGVAVKLFRRLSSILARPGPPSHMPPMGFGNQVLVIIAQLHFVAHFRRSHKVVDAQMAAYGCHCFLLPLKVAVGVGKDDCGGNFKNRAESNISVTIEISNLL